MTRLSLILLAVLTASALSLVSSQHDARKLFIALEEQQESSRQLDVEFGQLQLESSTWAMHARVERIARQALRMRLPESGRVKIIESAPRDGAAAHDGGAGNPVPPAGAAP
ncbi:MAG: cell division protein FtsL [Betaproteobacteria bacterium]|nr:cell division protein FtsL [Betaproteobacteria bacterium]